MAATATDGAATTSTREYRGAGTFVRSCAGALDSAAAFVPKRLLLHLAIVFLGYVIAGKLGQATTEIRSSNLGPVWPASGIALAGLLACGVRAWPAVLAGAFLVAFQSPVPALTALGQACGATAAAAGGALALRQLAGFTPRLSSLRDTLAVIVIGAFASSILSASIGLASLYASGLQPYSGLGSAWLIYWLGDATGVLLVTPLVFTLSSLLAIRSRKRLIELAALLTLLAGACLLVFGDLPLFSIRLHVLAFCVLPFVMWAAIRFGAGGSALSVFLVATMATLLTAAGFGPFSANTAFVNAVLLDVLFTVLALSGLALASVIAERERAEAERELLIENKKTEEALSNLSRRLIEAQEQERTRIARELHDDIGQRLSLLASSLSARADVELQHQASEIAADVQAISHRLHSSKLELLGMAATMRHFCSEFASQQKAVVRFESRDVPDRVSPDISLCLFRILQEALHNAVKHSGGARFEADVWSTDGQLQLVVRDHGRGFDVEMAKRGRGIGLVSMEERIKLVHGDLSIDSQPSRGTTIHARVPLRPSHT